MPVILRNTAAGRRACMIAQDELDEMLEAGKAKNCAPYGSLFEEVTPEEVAQGYMTRNMAALPIVSEPRKRGRPPKVRHEEPAPVVEAPAEAGAE